MGPNRTPVAVAAALLVLLAAPVRAHDFWIEPSTFHPGLGETLSLRLRVGERFVGDPVARDENSIERFLAAGPSDVRVLGRDGLDPAGIVALTQPGLWVVVYQSRPTPIEVEAGKFEAYLASEGLERISALRAGRGESRAPGRERYARCAKSLVAVGSAAAKDARAMEPVGLPLELVTEINPYALAPGGMLSVRLLYDGSPDPGALVTALNQSHPEANVASRTTTDGRTTLLLAAPGVWLLKAVHMDSLPPGGHEQFESHWASLTFEVGSSP